MIRQKTYSPLEIFVSDSAMFKKYYDTYLCFIFIIVFSMYLNITFFFVSFVFNRLWNFTHNIYIYIADVAEWSRALENKDKWLVLQCTNGASSNPVEGRTKSCQLKDLILTLFGLIFRPIYMNFWLYLRVCPFKLFSQSLYIYTWNWVEIIKCFKMVSWIKTHSVQIVFIHRTL